MGCSDCCRWRRIQCDAVTGNVESLHLRGSYDKRKLYSNDLSSSLAELRHLKYLDLSENYFNLSKIPEFIGSLKQLRYLNLSNARVYGNVPPHIGNLSNLKVLDLSSNYGLVTNDVTWTFRLSSLEHLDLSLFDLSRTQNWDTLLYMPPSLKELYLSNCKLSKADIRPFLNSSRILPKIQHLDLSQNYFEEIIDSPKYLSQCSQNALDLHEGLNGTFLQPHGRLSNLRGIDLSSSGLTGPIPESLGRLRFLEVLDLSDNQITGLIPESFGKLAALIDVYLEFNRLMGPIPTSLGRLGLLQTFWAYSNFLNGTIPVSIGQLTKLDSLRIANNSLEGVVSEAHFANLSMLKELDTSSNTKLTFNVSREWVPPFQLVKLQLSSCNVGNGFPQWLHNQRKLEKLVLSNASISGPLPTWLQKMKIIPFLDLSHNKLSGPLTNLPNRGYFGGLSPLLLENNLFNGSIPSSLCTRKDLDYLDLSRNRLTGKIPKCLWNQERLTTMILSSNKLSGVIPSYIALTSLVRLSLNDNNFIGELPRELGSLGRLTVLDLGDNKFSGSMPEWIGENLTSLMVLRLHKNNFTGRIPLSLCKSSHLQILDVAYNKLTGTIPRCLGELNFMAEGNPLFWHSSSIDYDENVIQAMKGVDLEYATTWDQVYNMDLSSNKLVGEIPVQLTGLHMLLGLNLSNNHLSGGIPDDIGNMTQLFSLDLSRNELTGRIPPSMAGLNFLSHLNLSYNNLSGRIPTGNQLQTLVDPSIYVGNKDLYGDPLPKNGSNHQDPITDESTKIHQDKAGDEPRNVWLFFLDIMYGFATGFWGIIGVLLFKKQWRQKLFMFVEETMDKIYVAVVVRVAKMKRGREAV
uniref:Disease resistance R13L4/SHOC-2-like LRR domain-containing protein n=1 Tax=Lactuca sativa TaxID=4236 RepID=A0A9R1XJK1_LACSA|nr:hypothetical protein LSAT_V11C300107940 [Lactuca sativa]